MHHYRFSGRKEETAGSTETDRRKPDRGSETSGHPPDHDMEADEKKSDQAVVFAFIENRFSAGENNSAG